MAWIAGMGGGGEGGKQFNVYTYREGRGGVSQNMLTIFSVHKCGRIIDFIFITIVFLSHWNNIKISSIS